MKIENDKIMHFLVCLTIAFIFSTIGANAIYKLAPDAPGMRTLLGAALGFVVAMLIGVEKERRDAKKQGNHFCWKDLLADTLGAVVGCLGGFISYLI